MTSTPAGSQWGGQAAQSITELQQHLADATARAERLEQELEKMTNIAKGCGEKAVPIPDKSPATPMTTLPLNRNHSGA